MKMTSEGEDGVMGKGRKGGRELETETETPRLLHIFCPISHQYPSQANVARGQLAVGA